MRKKDYLTKKLTSIEVNTKPISQLLEDMENTGFQGKMLGKSARVWKEMVLEKDNTIFLGYSGSLSTTGQSRIITWLVENRFIDILVSTGANISEDIFEGLGFSYFQGAPNTDDFDLLKNQIDRFYDVYADEMSYRKLEEFIYKFLDTLRQDYCYSSAEFLYLFGKFQDENNVDSISAAAYRAGVPIFSPAMADSGYGVAAYLFNKEKNKHIVLDQFKDFEQLGKIGELSDATSIIYIGGGVPKDTIQLVTVMKDLGLGGEDIYPHKYAIQITTDSPQWGGLSGCTFEEAVSWGKIDNSGTRAVCYCDATIALPLVTHALNEKVSKKREGTNFGWLFKQTPVNK